MKVALFGSTGQLGRSILSALESANIETLQIISPGSQSRAKPDSQTLTTITIDLTTVTRHDLSAALTGTDAVVSALGGNDVNAQSLIQDAAWDAGVKRFYPSEFGMHHIYRRPGEASGYIHPVLSLSSPGSRGYIN